MYNLLKKLAQNSAFYTFANSIEAFSPFLLAIILTRLLTPGEYGVWVLFIALVTFLRPVVNLTIQDALRMHFYEMDEPERASFVWSSFCLTSICTAAIVVATVVFAVPLSAAVSFPVEWLVSIPIAAYLFATFYFLLAYNQFAHDRRRFLGLHVIQTAASLAFISVLVFNGWSWPGVVIGKIAGLAVGCAAGIFWLFAGLHFADTIRQPPQLRRLARFGLLYLPTGMGLVAIPLTDRLIVTHVLGLAENGLYGVAALFGTAVFVVINGILHAWMPWLFRNLPDWHNRRREIIIVSAVFLGLLPIGGFIASVLAQPIAPWIIGSGFTAAFVMIPWAIAGTVSMGFFFHNQAYLHFKKAVLPMSLSSATCITLNAIFSYYGAIHYGVTGVFAATIGAFLVAGLISASFIIPQYHPKFANA
ncbi:MAG: lipopolysaccharide biosynthesis protein [Aestuariivirgaceae bacterium]